MTDFRRAQEQSHPTKTNTVLLGVILLLVLILSLQVWLLTAGLNTALGGDRSIVWPAFQASLVLFLAGAASLRYLPRPIRAVAARPVAESFPDASLAWRTLGTVLTREDGPALNGALVDTARLHGLFGLLFAAGIAVSGPGR